jgi:hypothetical protein
MADYYPLLAKAAAALPDPSPAARQAMYERARKALLGQLRAIDPPVAAEDIDRESVELDAAIARVEADFGVKPAASEPSRPPAPVAVAPPAPVMKFKASKPEEPKARESKPEEPKSEEAKPEESKGEETKAKESEAKEKAEPPSPAPEPETETGGKPPRFGLPSRARAGETPADEPAADLKAKLREPQRPLAPAPPASRENSRRLWIVGAALGIVVIGVAALAFLLRGSPDDLARLKPIAAPTADQGSGKLADRVGGAGNTPASNATPQKSTASANPAASPTPAQPQDNQAAPVSQPPIPVAQRSALLVEAPDTESKVRTYIGTVVWRLDNVPASAGQPLGTAVHADIDIPEAKIKATVDIRQNTDPALPAADTFEVRFNLLPGSVLPAIKQISVPQMRREETPNGEILAGVPVKITDTYFFVGLAQGDLATRNADLMRNRSWFDFPIQLADDRVAKLTIEKGPAGERMIADALTSWSQ